MVKSLVSTVCSRSDRAGFTPQTDPDSKVDPGFLKSIRLVILRDKTDPTEFYLGYPIGPKGETGKGSVMDDEWIQYW